MSKAINRLLGYRLLQLGWTIRVGDIVLDDFGNPQYKVESNNSWIGQQYRSTAHPNMLTPKPLQETLNKLPARIAKKKIAILKAYMHVKRFNKHRKESKWAKANLKIDLRYLPPIV